MGKPVCISYIRFSSSSQSDGASYDRQLEAAIAYADSHGMVLDNKYRYEDLGVSAFSGNHAKSGHLRAFLDCVERGEIPEGSVLVIEHFDRLSRENPFHAFNMFTSIILNGIKIVTLMDGAEYTKHSALDLGKLMIILTNMHRAHEEVSSRTTRILDAFSRKRNDLMNKKFTANCPTWLKLDPDRKSFTILHDRAEIVQRIFKMSYEGLGIKTISRMLNVEKIPPARSSLGWCQSTVRKILSSRSVIGEYQPHAYKYKDKIPAPGEKKKFWPEGDPALDYFPRIVEDDVFFAVQARLTNGSHKSGRTAKVENLFSGRTQCGYCGARMDIVTKHNKTEIARYLVCDQARRGVKCSYISIKCNEVERAFLTYCKEVDIINVLRREGNEDQKKLAQHTKQVASKNGELLDINRQLELLDGELSQITDHLEMTFFRKRLNTLLHKQAEIQESIARSEQEINELTSSMRDANTQINNILTLLDQYDSSLSDDERILVRTRLRNEIRQIVIQVLVYPRGNIASNEKIEETRNKFDIEIAASDGNKRDALIFERDHVIEQMLLTQKNTKDDRYFKVIFRNGNSRHIKYSKEDGTYKVTFDRIGNQLDWSMGGIKMPTIVLDTDDQLSDGAE